MTRTARLPLAILFLIGAAVVLTVAFVLWRPTPQLSRATSLAARGEQIYNANCASCHGGPTGGTMMDYPPKHNARGHTWHHSDCELKEIVRTGGGPMIEMMRQMMAPPGAPTMPAWREKLSDEEIDAVLAYIKTMWTADEREFQERVTTDQCA